VTLSGTGTLRGERYEAEEERMPRPKILCPDDDTPCTEVRWVRGADVGSAFSRVAMYPKSSPREVTRIDKQGRRTTTWRNFGEYRFWCPVCGKEWIYHTGDRSIEPIPNNGPSSQFVYDPERGVLVPRPGGER
jgi:hypothetical protein